MISPLVMIIMRRLVVRGSRSTTLRSVIVLHFFKRAKLIKQVHLFSRSHLIELNPIWHQCIEHNQLKFKNYSKYKFLAK